MADRTLKFRRLKEIFARFGVQWDAGKGNGSHGSFYKSMDAGMFTYPVPDQKDVLICYVRGCRKKFKLTDDDGVSDREFYEG